MSAVTDSFDHENTNMAHRILSADISESIEIYTHSISWN